MARRGKADILAQIRLAYVAPCGSVGEGGQREQASYRHHSCARSKCIIWPESRGGYSDQCSFPPGAGCSLSPPPPAPPVTSGCIDDMVAPEEMHGVPSWGGHAGKGAAGRDDWGF